MARQLTKCISPSDVRPWWLHASLGALAAGGVGSAIGAAIAAGAGATAWPIILSVGGIAAPLGIVIGFCDWFFNWRLVCITDEEIAVGTVNRTDVWFDGDFTVDMVLSPCVPGCTLAQVQAGFQGRLMQNQHASLPFDPFAAADTAMGTPVMHQEIEGTRMRTVCDVATGFGVVGTAAGIATFAACAAAIGWTGIGLLLCLLAGLAVAAAAEAIGAGIGYLVGSEASPSEAGEDRSIGKDDCVVVRGRWIYDSGHTGWNEIHAVMRLMKLEQGDCKDLDEERLKRIDQLVREADDVGTRRDELSQSKNRYLTHRAVG